MRKVLVLSLAAAALLATTTASSAQGRSGIHQGDFSTCSSSRHACLIGVNRRGDSARGCERAYRTCMRTGTWDTYGLYGRRVTGVVRQ
jgi:hypothetical protein